MTIDLDNKHTSRDSFVEEDFHPVNTRKTKYSNNNLDLLQLEELNFPIKKPVTVRKRVSVRKSMTEDKQAYFIKVSNRGKD